MHKFVSGLSYSAFHQGSKCESLRGPNLIRGIVRVLLDREADKLVFEFVTDADGAARRVPKALPPPKKPRAEENV